MSSVTCSCPEDVSDIPKSEPHTNNCIINYYVVSPRLSLYLVCVVLLRRNIPHRYIKKSTSVAEIVFWVTFLMTKLELDRLHIYPIVPTPESLLSRLSEQPMVRPIVIATDYILKCLVYTGGEEGQFLAVN